MHTHLLWFVHYTNLLWCVFIHIYYGFYAHLSMFVHIHIYYGLYTYTAIMVCMHTIYYGLYAYTSIIVCMYTHLHELYCDVMCLFVNRDGRVPPADLHPLGWTPLLSDAPSATACSITLPGGSTTRGTKVRHSWPVSVYLIPESLRPPAEARPLSPGVPPWSSHAWPAL